jgi:hypothetical protein
VRGVKNIFDFQYEDFALENYQSHPSLDSFYTQKYQPDFVKRVQEVLSDDFYVDSLTTKELQ